MAQQVDLNLAQRIVEILNDMVEADTPAIAALIANRVPCNQKLADHPTIQCGVQHGGFNVGLLGLLNGICGSYTEGPKTGFGPIAAIFEEDAEHPGGFNNLVRFKIIENIWDKE